MNSPAANALIVFAIKALTKSHTLATTQGFIHLADHRAGGSLTDAEQTIVLEIENAFKSGGLHPPGVVEILKNDKDRIRLYRYLIDEKILVATSVANKPKSLTNTIVFHNTGRVRRPDRSLVSRCHKTLLFSMDHAMTVPRRSTRYTVSRESLTGHLSTIPFVLIPQACRRLRIFVTEEMESPVTVVSSLKNPSSRISIRLC